MLDKNFWRAALIRAVRTVAQTAVATIGSAAVIEQINWLTVLSASMLAGILSILTSVATGLPETDIPAPEVRVVYLDEDGSHIVDCDGETCDLSQYVDGGEDDVGDA